MLDATCTPARACRAGGWMPMARVCLFRACRCSKTFTVTPSCSSAAARYRPTGPPPAIRTSASMSVLPASQDLVEGRRALHGPARGSGSGQLRGRIAAPDGGEAVPADVGLPERQRGHTEQGKGGGAADEVVVQRLPGGQDFRVRQQLPEFRGIKVVQYVVGNHDVEPGAFPDQVAAVRLPEVDARDCRTPAGECGGARVRIDAGDVDWPAVPLCPAREHDGKVAATGADVQHGQWALLRCSGGAQLRPVQPPPTG